MKPIRDFVLVKPFAPEEITEGGLFLPEGYRERNCMAKVISVGRGTAKVKMEAKKYKTFLNFGIELIILVFYKPPIRKNQANCKFKIFFIY